MRVCVRMPPLRPGLALLPYVARLLCGDVSTEPPPWPDPLLTVAQVCRTARCAQSTVYSAIHGGRLQAEYEPGEQIRVRYSAMRLWLALCPLKRYFRL